MARKYGRKLPWCLVQALVGAGIAVRFVVCCVIAVVSDHRINLTGTSA